MCDHSEQTFLFGQMRIVIKIIPLDKLKKPGMQLYLNTSTLHMLLYTVHIKYAYQ